MGVAHNKALRRFLYRVRHLLALAVVAALVWFARAEWFWWAAGVSFCGELVQLWAASCLQKHEVFQPCGPYTLVRNPMYVGRFLVLSGMAAVTACPWLLLAYAPVFFFYAVGRVSREERKLAERFGVPYQAYLAAVPRFVPIPGKVYRAHGALLSFSWGLVVRNREHLILLGLVAFFVLVRLRLAL